MLVVKEWLTAHRMDCEVTAHADATTYRFESDAEAMLFSLRLSYSRPVMTTGWQDDR